jgi:hypothetical protein
MTKIKDLKSKQTKIAVFGGSSAAGYGSPINFVEFLSSCIYLMKVKFFII